MTNSEIAIAELQPRFGWARRCAILGFVVVALAASCSLAAYYTIGPEAIRAALLAVTACTAGIVAGHAIHALFPPGVAAASRILLMSGVRTAVPLALCVLLIAQRSPMVDQGFAYWLLGSYLTLLAIDTALAMPARRDR
jgi:hypothetical protein